MKSLINFVVLCLAAAVVASSAVAQVVPQNRLTPQQFYDNCGTSCDPFTPMAPAVGKGNRVAAAASYDVVIGVLRGPGRQVRMGQEVQFALGVAKDVNLEVYAYGRVFRVKDGKADQFGEPFYVDAAPTRYGRGYFERLDAGGTIPLHTRRISSEAQFGNQYVFQVTLTISRDGGRPFQNLISRFYVGLAGMNVSGERFRLTGATLVPGGIRLDGQFPIGVSALIEVGNPGWVTGYAEGVSRDGRSITIPVPKDEFGNPLYPAGWPVEQAWDVTVHLDGESATLLNAVTVQGVVNK